MHTAFRWLLASLLTLTLTGVAFAQAGDPEAEAFRDAFLAGELSWDDVLERARAEGEVVWGHWGGSDQLNQWIDFVVVPRMAEYGITLRTSRVPDTRDAVDLALAEARSGRGLGQGSIDTIWINGENFLTLSTQELLFGSFADALPNSSNFYWDPANPASGPNLFDFGHPTDRAEMPWSGDSFTCFFNSANVARADLPATHLELEAWLRENPGRFTYIRPPQFNGNAFVSGVFYGLNPDGDGHRSFQGTAQEMGPDEFIRLTRPAYEWMRRVEPFLLGGGGSDGNRGSPIYPAGPDGLEAHLVNGEIDIGCRYGLYNTATKLETGVFPEAVENFVWPDTGMIKNKNFLVIVGNAPNPAAALVFVNEMASADMQYSQIVELGYPLGVDADLVGDDFEQRVLADAPSLVGITYDELSAATVPNTHATLINVQEEVWIEYVERRSSDDFEAIVRAAFANLD